VYAVFSHLHNSIPASKIYKLFSNHLFESTSYYWRYFKLGTNMYNLALPKYLYTIAILIQVSRKFSDACLFCFKALVLCTTCAASNILPITSIQTLQRIFILVSIYMQPFCKSSDFFQNLFSYYYTATNEALSLFFFIVSYLVASVVSK